MSESKPQLADLALDLDELAWCEITAMGDQLGMRRSALQRFDDSTPDYHKLLKAMDLWLKTDNRASWERVVVALVAIGKDDLAQEMGKKYCRPASASQYRVAAAPHAVGAPSLRQSPPARNLHLFAARSPETSGDQEQLDVVKEIAPTAIFDQTNVTQPPQKQSTKSSHTASRAIPGTRRYRGRTLELIG